MQLTDVLDAPFVLPSIPRVVALLLSELEREDPDLKKITQLLSIDPALAMRLMQLANSAYFRLSGRVHSVSEALAVVGLNHVRTMAQGSAALASPRAVPGIQLQQVWTYSLDVAKVSRSLAGVVRQNQQAAFTAGLVHYVGELVLRLVLPDAMAQIDEDLPLLDARRGRLERRILGFHYADVVAELARRWLFPDAMVEALAHQDAPFRDKSYEPLAGVLHLASWRARCRDAGLGQREMAVSFPGAVGEVLLLDIDMVLQQDPIDWTSPRG